MMEQRLISENVVLLDQVFRDLKPAYFKVRFWTGEEWNPPGLEEPKVTIVIKNPGILAHLLAFPTDVRFGEAYIYDDLDFEGDIYAVFPLGEYLRKIYPRFLTSPTFWRKVFKLRMSARRARRLEGRGAAKLKGKVHSIERDKQAISYHYDLPPEFYACYLDPMMVYSCAYFRSYEDDLATAQKNKMELICRKLRLRPGERVLDIGCGWGGFVIYAAKKYRVKILGITLSENQAKFAQEWIKREGLEDLAEVRLLDYRQVDEKEPFDKLVSIGMFEHVGSSKLWTYFRKAWKLLKPGGLFLNHGIAADWSWRIKRWSFTDRYVFPDGELVPIYKTLTIAEKIGFEIRDVESLREHYVLTLRNWVKNLENNYDKVRQIVDEPTYRVWRLYMAGSAYAFSINEQSVFQTLLVKNRERGENDLPLTREDIYLNWDILK
ncbi:cyclopropane-fatty-acyl-phospholipid synthase [Thermodesulfatator autotrophicus]|uniref:Cyclopropane-fatty-acyl-phospholipid synthase n=2 Tax=Thermodesulfatator autotrophicus TaxID=1795632 RepID=A0A177E895_9BACT|nr:cyclopropane-fatty-acyl-phospholipid synthase [Thermodesulfatator autotrophicus]